MSFFKLLIRSNSFISSSDSLLFTCIVVLNIRDSLGKMLEEKY